MSPAIGAQGEGFGTLHASSRRATRTPPRVCVPKRQRLASRFRGHWPSFESSCLSPRVELGSGSAVRRSPRHAALERFHRPLRDQDWLLRVEVVVEYLEPDRSRVPHYP